MINIKVDATKTMAMLAGLEKQVKYATARALTATAKKIQAELPGELERALDRPTDFTKKGTFVTRAERDNLTAVVGFKDRQASYLKWQIEGGTRAPTKKALRLPSAVKLDAFGNLPKGIIKQLIAFARKERKMAKKTSKRIAISNKVDLFYGDPADLGGKRFPPGIYKIVKQGDRGQLIPLVVFPAVSAKYKPRLHLQRFAQSVVDREWQSQFATAWSEAMRTAR